MINDIKKTKTKLSIIFSIIVFIVILILGVSFLSVKYFNGFKKQKSNFVSFERLINSWKLIKLKSMWNRFEKNFFAKKHLDDSVQDLSINHIHLDKNNLFISKFIKDDIKIKYFKEILEKNKYFKTTYEKGFLIKKFRLKKGEKLIIFKKLKYDLEDYFEDVFMFLIVSLFFTLLIYFVSRRFVDKTFVPVEQNIDDMKNFIHNAGHELKTPISVIDSNLQLLEDMKKFDKFMNKEMRSELKKLNSLIDCLVNLSDIWSFKKIDKNDLKNILEEILKEFSSKIKDKKLKISLEIKNDLFIYSNKGYLYIFLSNLIWNAIKYNIYKWTINIYYKNWQLIIKDSWVWIAKKDLDKIFDRFYKSDISRNSEGFWIWLSLVKKIADVYKWKIGVESKENQGSEFRVWF